MCKISTNCDNWPNLVTLTVAQRSQSASESLGTRMWEGERVDHQNCPKTITRRKWDLEQTDRESSFIALQPLLLILSSLSLVLSQPLFLSLSLCLSHLLSVATGNVQSNHHRPRPQMKSGVPKIRERGQWWLWCWSSSQRGCLLIWPGLRCWWSSGQRTCLLLRRSESESRWSLQIFCKIFAENNENKQKEAGVGRFNKVAEVLFCLFFVFSNTNPILQLRWLS